jgi:type IV secretory pathway VirJ component
MAGMSKAWPAAAAAAVTTSGALLLAWSAWLGWFGGATFTDVRPAPGAARAPVPAVFFSGDLGFKIGMGPRVAARLAARGIPVTGVNSLTVFNRPSTPADAARLIEAAIARAAPAGGRVALIGQSFGADMLQAGLSVLPARERGRVSLVALVVPGARIQFETSPAGLFTFASPETSGLATAGRLDWVKTLCVQGVTEEGSLCPLLHRPNVTRVALPGGHQLEWNPDPLAALLAGAIRSAGADGGTGSLRIAASIPSSEKGI